MEGSGFRDLTAQYEAKNAVILGCSFDTPEENRKFAEKFKFPFRLISDTDRKIGLIYGACEKLTDEFARRIAYVIDEKGRVAQAHPRVSAANYPKEQLESL